MNNECRITYIHQPGPVAKNATSRPSGWELALKLHFSQLVLVGECILFDTRYGENVFMNFHEAFMNVHE